MISNLPLATSVRIFGTRRQNGNCCMLQAAVLQNLHLLQHDLWICRNADVHGLPSKLYAINFNHTSNSNSRHAPAAYKRLGPAGPSARGGRTGGARAPWLHCSWEFLGSYGERKHPCITKLSKCHLNMITPFGSSEGSVCTLRGNVTTANGI